MLEVALAIPYWLELTATVFCAISGAMAAVRARYDVFGVVCLAIVTGLAGGMIRDVLLQDYGIYAFQRPSLILACVVMGLVVFYLGRLVTYFNPITDFVECLSTALFVVIGTGKGLSAGQGVVPSIILGMLTAVGGGIMRDMTMARPPQTFQAGTLYSVAALVGGTVYALMKQNNLFESYAAVSCVILVIVLRYAAIYFNWTTTTAHDHSDDVVRAVAKPVVFIAQKARPPKGKLAREKSLSTYGKIAVRLQEWVAKFENNEVVTTDEAAGGKAAGASVGACAPDATARFARIPGGAEPKTAAAATKPASEGTKDAEPGDLPVPEDPFDDQGQVVESDHIVVDREEFRRTLSGLSGKLPTVR